MDNSILRYPKVLKGWRIRPDFGHGEEVPPAGDRRGAQESPGAKARWVRLVARGVGPVAPPDEAPAPGGALATAFHTIYALSQILTSGMQLKPIFTFPGAANNKCGEIKKGRW